MHTFSSLLALAASLLLTHAHALPADTVLPQDAPPYSTRDCGSVDASIKKERTCAGFSQQSVLFTTVQEIDSSIISMIGDAVRESGGSVGQTFGMKGFKGLSIKAPAKVLDLVEAFGAPHGLKMEGNCMAHVMPFVPKLGGPGTRSTGGPGVDIMPPPY